ncbi:MAG: RIP metalloprotease RseP [Bacteroidales bacterium]|nr:RIP metalloprotease RseP [Bacteroidales bacterium]
MEIFIKITQFVLSLSILIILHELGHYIPAKLFKTKVEKFYLFFDPWFSLFKIKRKDTEYGIGWIPLGGYCKISGMIDESMDKEQLKKPPEPWEFRSKPAWQRLIIMLGGVFVNLILAIFIYIFLLYFLGEQYLPTKNLKYGIYCDTLALDMGFRNGDKILTVDDKYIENFTDVPIEILTAKSVQVERDGKKVDIPINKSSIDKIFERRKAMIFTPQMLFVINDFQKKSAAKDAGLKKGDMIVGINGKHTRYFDEIKAELSKLKNKQTEILALRKKDTLKFKVSIPSSGLIGVALKEPDFEFKTKTHTFLSAIPAGVARAFKTTADYIKQIKLIFTQQKAFESVGGFIAIGNIFAPHWDWIHFWTITAFLSVALAFLNILPIPALDGGHVLFLLYEIITGRKPNDKFLEYAQVAGMIFLLILVLLVNGNDVLRLFR